MTVSVTDSEPVNLGGHGGKVIRLDVTSYPNGTGFDVSPSTLGLEGSSTPWILNAVAEEDILFFQHDQANDKMLVADESGEIADTTDIGVVRLTVLSPAPI